MKIACTKGVPARIPGDLQKRVELRGEVPTMRPPMSNEGVSSVSQVVIRGVRWRGRRGAWEMELVEVGMAQGVRAAESWVAMTEEETVKGAELKSSGILQSVIEEQQVRIKEGEAEDNEEKGR